MIKDLILSMDILSPRPKFKIERKNRFHTLLGGVFSLFGYILIGISAGYFSIILITRKEKSIVSNLNPIENPQFNFSQIPMAFVMTDY